MQSHRVQKPVAFQAIWVHIDDYQEWNRESLL
jgi:hypothetical protein